MGLPSSLNDLYMHTLYSVRWWETKGIVTIRVDESNINNGSVVYRVGCSSYHDKIGTGLFWVREDAVERANNLKAMKIASLARKMLKLENMEIK